MTPTDTLETIPLERVPSVGGDIVIPTGETLSQYHDRVDGAMARGVAKALADHKRDGDPVAVWEDGAVKVIPAEEIPSSSSSAAE